MQILLKQQGCELMLDSEPREVHRELSPILFFGDVDTIKSKIAWVSERPHLKEALKLS